MTLPGVMTPEYASPEQARGEIITTASDVYSLGVILYELLAGRRPYRVKSRRPDEMVRAVCESVPERPSVAVGRTETDPVQGLLDAPPDARRRLGGDLDNIVAMALRKEPARRYASVAGLSEDLRRHLAGLPVAARRDTLRYRVGKFIGRNKAGVAAAAFVLVALMVGLLIATWQAQVARRQRDRAERRFADVRRLSNALLFDIAPKMERLKGSTEARQALVQRAQEYLDSLVSEAGGDDPALQTELAAAYIKLGELRGDPLRPNLNDFAGAVASYEKANGILRALLARHLDDPALLSSYGALLKDLARVREWSGNMQGALDDARAASEAYDRLFRLVPGSLQERTNAAEALIQVARRHYFNEELAKVYAPLSAAIDALTNLLCLNPDNPEILNQLGRARTLLGNTLSWDNRQAEGEAEMTQAFDILEALVVAHPQDSIFRLSLLNAYQQGTQLYAEVDDARAHEIALKALAFAEQALSEDSADVQPQQNLAKILVQLGTSALRLHQAEAAVASLMRAEEAFTKLEANPRSARSYQIDLGLVAATLGEAWAEQGKFPEALASFQRAIEVYQAMAQADPANKMPMRRLANVYTYQGNCQWSLARTASDDTRETAMQAARESFRQALEEYAQLEAQQSLTAYGREKRQEVQRALDDLAGER